MLDRGKGINHFLDLLTAQDMEAIPHGYLQIYLDNILIIPRWLGDIGSGIDSFFNLLGWYLQSLCIQWLRSECSLEVKTIGTVDRVKKSQLMQALDQIISPNSNLLGLRVVTPIITLMD